MFSTFNQIWLFVIGGADAHASGLGAIAALVGVPILVFQVRQARKQEQYRLHARRMAALSILPMTLSAINSWAKAVADSQARIYRWAKGEDGGAPYPSYFAPKLPEHLIGAIERMIEAAPNERISRTLTAIVAQIQVLSARVGDSEQFAQGRVRGQGHSIDDNLLRAASIHALADSLYDDARALSERVPHDYVRMSSVLNIMGIRDGQYAATHALLANYAAKARNAPRGWREGILRSVGLARGSKN